MIRHLSLASPGPGLHEITAEVAGALRESGLREGLLTLFLRHTSASLLIQENADPSARHDLERWLERLVPEEDPHFTHRLEGPDDMPSHIKTALTTTSLAIPFFDGRLLLGTWQGVFLWEHRRGKRRRELVLHFTA